ncbi:MAG: ribosome small subunit-dependent GTPase A [Candidatus Paceibacterota bacterium]|jgi:ribosome biogenesis GTPase
MDLQSLGYNDFFESGRKRLGLDSFVVARVIAEHRESYRVVNATGEYTAKITGKQMFVATSREDYPAVGDWVSVTELNAEQAVIQAVLPRKTILKRRGVGSSDAQIIAANVDIAFIVQAAVRDFNVNRLERYAAMTAAGGVQSSIILNKIDLISKAELDDIVSRIRMRFPETNIIPISTVTGDGLNELVIQLERRKTYCFVGSSGVGKSSIINNLLGENVLATGQIRIRMNKGKHVTTSRSLFVLNGGAMVIDNPGMRELGMLDSETGIGEIFNKIVEIEKLCKFSDCTHTNEPGCVVRSALESGTLNERQYESYEKLKRENEFSDMTNLEKRGKDRAFGKFVKKAKEQIAKYK